MKIPKASPDAVAFLRSMFPTYDKRIKIKPMFGNIAAFVNGNLFAGLYGEDLFVRLSQPDEKMLLQIKGATPFAPMKGRTMKGYVVIPKTYKNDQGMVKPWLGKSLDYVSTLPPKNKKLPK